MNFTEWARYKIRKALAFDKAEKKRLAEEHAAAQGLFWDNEVKRLNYYTLIDFANSKDPNAPTIPPPTPAQWATLTQAQKDVPGLVRFP